MNEFLLFFKFSSYGWRVLSLIYREGGGQAESELKPIVPEPSGSQSIQGPYPNKTSSYWMSTKYILRA